MANTKEYLTLIKLGTQLRIGFKKDMITLADRFRNVGLIDNSCHGTVTTTPSLISDYDKANKMLQGVMDSIMSSTEYYALMISALSENKLMYGTLIDQLNTEYEAQGTTESGGIPAVQQPVHHVVSTWNKDVKLFLLRIIKYQDQNGEEKELRLLDEIAYNWREIGELLGLPAAFIRTVQHPGAGKTPSQCLWDIIAEWLKNAPALPCYNKYPNSWQGVYNLLMDSLNATVAKNLEEALNADYSDLRGNYGSAPPGRRVVVQARAPIQSPASAPVVAPQQQQQPPAQAPVVATSAPQQHPPTKGKRKKMNNEALATWLQGEGVNEQDIDLLRGKGVNEMLFLKLNADDKILQGATDAFLLILDDLKDGLRLL